MGCTRRFVVTLLAATLGACKAMTVEIPSDAVVDEASDVARDDSNRSEPDVVDSPCGQTRTYAVDVCASESDVRTAVMGICAAGGETAADVSFLACGASATSAHWTCCHGASTPCDTSQVGGSACRTEAAWREQAIAECTGNGATLGTFALGLACAGSSTGVQGATYRCCAP